MINDIYETICLLENCRDHVISITKKTIYAFLNGHFKDDNLNDYFSENQLFGKYMDQKDLNQLIKKYLKYLVERRRIGCFESEKPGVDCYFSIRYKNGIHTNLNKYVNNKKDEIFLHNDEGCIPFSLTEFKSINENYFLKCMFECYPLVDTSNLIRTERIYSWIDSFRTLKNIANNRDFYETTKFLFEYKIKTTKQYFYLDLVMRNHLYSQIIEFKQKNIYDVFYNSQIARKLKFESSVYDDDEDDLLGSYILCTRDDSNSYIELEELFEIISSESAIQRL
ncbi:MAG: hypothetical protein K5765_06360 [Clostridia bacterium]|nr:hypothetical protein [Clostridia bacterium]